MPGASRPNVYTFADYRRYLAAYYDYAKAEQYGFSFRVFSRRAKIRSSNYLRLVIDGERNLTREMAGRFAEACELTGAGREFFCELVEYCQGKTAQERSRMYERLARYRPFREARRLEAAQAEYHSHWYLPAIRELVRRADFSSDPKWIAKQLVPAISAAQAKRAFELLCKLGLLEQGSEGRVAQTSEIITTGLGPLGHHILRLSGSGATLLASRELEARVGSVTVVGQTAVYVRGAADACEPTTHLETFALDAGLTPLASLELPGDGWSVVAPTLGGAHEGSILLQRDRGFAKVDIDADGNVSLTSFQTTPSLVSDVRLDGDTLRATSGNQVLRLSP